MAEHDKEKTVTLQEVIVLTLATADTLTKLLIDKGLITDEEFKKKLSEEKATYHAVLKRLH
jgi:hypothetical protein